MSRLALQSVVTSNVTSLAFSVGAAFTALSTKRVNLIYTASFGALIVLYFLVYVFFLLRDSRRIRNWANGNKYPIVYTAVEHDWRLTADGGFWGKYLYSAKNISNEPVGIIPTDDVLWFDDPQNLNIQFKSRDETRKYLILDHRHSTYNYFLAVLGSRVKSISWSHIVEPPIAPGDVFRYELEIDSPGTERKAFTDEGTYAGVPATIPTQAATLNYVAPLGFKFDLLEPVIVVDSKGTKYPQEYGDVPPPTLSASGTILNWSLQRLKTGRRYWFRYRVVKL